jgi:hypothetical protein
MARKVRKKSAAKAKNKSKPVTKTKRKPVAKKEMTRTPQPRSFTDRIADAYRTVIDTVKGTDRLRNKLEPPATSETE